MGESNSQLGKRHTAHTRGERENDRKVKADGLYRESNRRCHVYYPLEEEEENVFIFIYVHFFFQKIKCFSIFSFRAPIVERLTVAQSDRLSLLFFLLSPRAHMPSTLREPEKRFASFPPSFILRLHGRSTAEVFYARCTRHGIVKYIQSEIPYLLLCI